jgi:hypothetical protein
VRRWLLSLGLLTACSNQSSAVVHLCVNLAADRCGGQNRAIVRDSQPILFLDLEGLPPAPQFDVQVVDADGQEVYRQTILRMPKDIAVVNVYKSLAPGTYWVRLSDAGSPIREYGLLVHPTAAQEKSVHVCAA